MKTSNVLGLILMGASMLTARNASATLENVALGASVSSSGTFWSSSAALSTVVDGTFLPATTEWTTGTVHWSDASDTDPATTPSIVIDFGRSHVITGFVVQVDDNDSYRLEYYDGANWNVAWDVPNYDAYSWGMTTRPNINNNSEIYFLPSAITAYQLRLTAVSGDGLYSVSEIQAFSPVPEPATWMAGLGAGAVLMGTFLRRAKR